MHRNATDQRSSLASRAVVATVAAGFVTAVVTDAAAARRGGPVVIEPSGSFIDELAQYDTKRWIKADRWTNGSPFDNAWRADHVTHDAATAGGTMSLKLSNQRFLGEPYSAGEYRTRGFHGYGCYEARFKPIRQPGVVTSFFTFAGPHDNGGNGRHNEIDVEFLGKDTTRVQFNFWTNDDGYTTHNEVWQQLGFDAADAFHNYGFRWTARGIEWYVDGQLVYAFADDALNPTPKASDSYQKIMMNAWPVDATAAAWAGTFRYDGVQHARYEWVRYDASVGCTFTWPGQGPALGST